MQGYPDFLGLGGGGFGEEVTITLPKHAERSGPFDETNAMGGALNEILFRTVRHVSYGEGPCEYDKDGFCEVCGRNAKGQKAVEEEIKVKIDRRNNIIEFEGRRFSITKLPMEGEDSSSLN